MILLDTSIVIAALSADRPSLPALHRVLDLGEKVNLCTMVLYEWLRGPRIAIEITDQELLFPSAEILPFTAPEAALAADLYRSVPSARNREIDITIAATAIHHKARLWTLNTGDFANIPGLQLYKPR